MKTNKNSKTILAAHPSQSDEQSGTDTKHQAKYEVILALAQTSSKRIFVEASSADHAWEIGDQYEVGDFDDWEVQEDQMSVCSVELLTGGQSDE